MFWKRRMFWNVRPSPATTMSFGRALLNTPNRISIRWYHGGRDTPRSIDTISVRTVRAIPMMIEVLLAVSKPRTIVTNATIAPGRTQMTGSSQGRCEWAIIRRPANSITPPDGS
jgi:hypothetical protein